MKRIACAMVFLVSTLAGGMLWSQDPGESPQAPNIVFVIADDLGWGDVGFHGSVAPTPHLDRLAEEGLELTQHYVAPVCSPTRVGLLTGRNWSRFGVTTPTNTRALPADTKTLPRALSRAGYQTCLIGKWHLGSKPEWGPNRYGFDHAYGSLAGGVTAWSHRYKQGPFSKTWHRNGELIEEQGHVTDLLTEEAVSWIDACGDKPFFLYVPFTAVHLPIHEPDQWLSRVPASVRGEINRQYAACVMHFDSAVGRLLAALDKKGLRENTLFVVTSDNGGSTATNNTQPYPADGSPSGKLPGSNAPLRGEKGSVYEGGIRVPTLVSWPSRKLSGKRAVPVAIYDWMPTFCRLSGYRASDDLKWDGVDLGPLLWGEGLAEDRPLYVAGPRWKSVALRMGEWKLVASGDEPRQKVELFHLASDPGETQDRSEQESDRIKRLLAMLRIQQAADRDSVVQD